MAEETQAQDDFVIPDGTDQTTEEESTEETEVEESSEEQTQDEETSQDDSTEESQASEAEEETDSGESQQQEVKDQKELAREAYQKRQEAKRQREEQNSKQQQEYIDAAEDEQEQALRELQVEAYNNKIDRTTDKLVNSFERAVADIEMFRTGTPEQQEELQHAIDEFDAMHVTYDRNGNPINVTGDLHSFLQNKAARIQKLAQAGARKEKTAGAKQRSATTPAPSASPPKPKSDLLELWSA